MIKSLTVTNNVGDGLKITLNEYEPDHGLMVRSIDGLGPPKANINFTEIATMDGSIYNSALAEKRNIVISIVFSMGPTIETARQRTYKYFPVKSKVELSIETENKSVRTEGYVESNEPDIFSKDESSQISIICPNPYLYSNDGDGYQLTDFYGVEKLFEFEFSAEWHLENGKESYKTLEFGNLDDKEEKVLTYMGEVPTGCEITIRAMGDITDYIIIYNARTREQMKIDITKIPGSKMVLYDEIIVNTNIGEKGIILSRGGKDQNIINALDRDSDWFWLNKGDNIFAFKVGDGFENLQVSIKNNIVYEGA